MVALVAIMYTYHAKGEEKANTKHDAIAPTLAEGRSRRANRSTAASHVVRCSLFQRQASKRRLSNQPSGADEVSIPQCIPTITVSRLQLGPKTAISSLSTAHNHLVDWQSGRHMIG